MAGAGSDAAHGNRNQTSRARSRHAVSSHRSNGAVTVLGSASDLGQPEKHAQPDDGREGTRVGARPHTQAGKSGRLQERHHASVGENVSAGERKPSTFNVRPGDK